MKDELEFVDSLSLHFYLLAKNGNSAINKYTHILDNVPCEKYYLVILFGHYYIRVKKLMI